MNVALTLTWQQGLFIYVVCAAIVTVFAYAIAKWM